MTRKEYKALRKKYRSGSITIADFHGKLVAEGAYPKQWLKFEMIEMLYVFLGCSVAVLITLLIF